MHIRSFEGLLGAFALLWGSLASAIEAPHTDGTPICFFVSSYHLQDTWSSGIERGLREVLGGACHLHTFDLDSARNPSASDKKRRARFAHEAIQRLQPQVLIVSDDDAARYLAVPYYKDTAMPIVFSGLNWTVEEYGFPGQNATGIIETMPLIPMLRQAKRLTHGGTRATFLAANSMSAFKNFLRIQRQAQRMGIEVITHFVESQAAWLQVYQALQASEDFLLLGSPSAIRDWQPQSAALLQTLLKMSRIPSFTTDLSMLCYATVGYVKVPEEHGRWAGLAARHVLEGVPVTDMPVVNSRDWDMWHHEGLAKQVLRGQHRSLHLRAKKAHCDMR